MRPLLATATLLLCSALPSVANQQQQPTNGKDGSTANLPSQGSPVTVIVNQPTPPAQADHPQQKSRRGPPIYSNWVLAALAGIAAWAGLRNLRQIKIQSKATQDAAKAASDNAEAVMRGERAWLLIDGIEADPDFAGRGEPHFTYRVANYGATPGFMISANAYVQMEDTTDYTYDTEFMKVGGMSDDSVITPHGEPLRLFGNDVTAQPRQFMVTDEDRPKLFDSAPRAYLWAVGSIWYHDVFGKVCSTPFAYWYDVTDKKFIRVRWPGINKPT